MGEFNYGAALVGDLGSLDNGGRIKLTTATGETKWKSLSADKLRRIAAIVAEPEDARIGSDALALEPGETLDLLTSWIKGDVSALIRARRVVLADDEDGTALIGWWVETVVLGEAKGPFTPEREQMFDPAKVTYLRRTIKRSDLFDVDWTAFSDRVREV